MSVVGSIIPGSVKQRLITVKSFQEWRRRGYAAPVPNVLKRSVFARHGRLDDTWIETGTYLGTTTAHLARTASHVYTIEPDHKLAADATARFAETPNVTVVEGLSEEMLDSVLAAVDGSVSFWLDGHYSEGVTHKGPSITPIAAEFAVIEQHLERLDAVSILVDDFRCFDSDLPEDEGYPSRSWLVAWADAQNLRWTVEHDIFVAVSR